MHCRSASKMPREAPAVLKTDPPAAHWPTKGKIDIQHLTVRYRPGLEPALRDVNVSIEAGEKIGVVGRTGSGKSTLTLALLRIIEPALDSPKLSEIHMCMHIEMGTYEHSMIFRRQYHQSVSFLLPFPLAFFFVIAVTNVFIAQVLHSHVTVKF